MRDIPTRIPPVTDEDLDPELRPILDGLSQGMGGRLNVFATIAQHPDLFRSWLRFASHVLLSSTLPPRDRELLILRTAVANGCDYEFAHHRGLGAREGLTEAEIERVKDGPDAPGWSAPDAALLTAVDELCADSVVGQGTWDLLSQRYDTRQMMDAVFCIGQYTMLSMALNSFGVETDDGFTGF